MRKTFWILLLPLLMLFAQHAELRHAFGHDAEQTTGDQKPAPGEPCPTCLAYAHVTGAVKPDVSAAGLLSHLSFHFAPAERFASASVDAFSPRSRGPPIL